MIKTGSKIILLLALPTVIAACVGSNENESSSSNSSNTSSSSSSNGQWQTCAQEGEVCRFSGFSAVRYGVEGSWSEGLYQDQVDCNADVFHTLALVDATCEYNLEPITEAAPVASSSSSSSASSGTPGAPPLSGTVFLDPDIIRPGDPTLYQSMVYTGQAQRRAWHSGYSETRTFNAYTFDLAFSDGDIVEVAVESALGSQAQARLEADKLAIPLGQIPAILRSHINSLTVFTGTGRGTASLGGLVSTYATDNATKIQNGQLEEFLVHEATHTALDAIYYPNSAYQQAVIDDNNFISTYARDYPTSEDISETIVAYLAVRLRADRISAYWESKIRTAIGHRIAFFDSENLDWFPVHNTSANVRSEMTSPFAGGNLDDSSVTFNWTMLDDATSYDLILGTKGLGSNDIRTSNPTADTYLIVDNLPADGKKVFARLGTQVAGEWRYDDFTFQGFDPDKTAAEMLLPRDADQLNSSNLTIAWDKPPGATEFDLLVGDQGVGSYNVRASEITTNTSAKLTNLPTKGQVIYVRLLTKNGVWQYRDYTLVAASDSPTAKLISPTPGSVLNSSTVVFKWNTPIGAQSYDLMVGTSGPGSTDIRASDTVNYNTITLNNMPTDGRRVYVRLWTFTNRWESIDYVF